MSKITDTFAHTLLVKIASSGVKYHPMPKPEFEPMKPTIDTKGLPQQKTKAVKQKVKYTDVAKGYIPKPVPKNQEQFEKEFGEGERATADQMAAEWNAKYRK